MPAIRSFGYSPGMGQVGQASGGGISPQVLALIASLENQRAQQQIAAQQAAEDRAMRMEAIKSQERLYMAGLSAKEKDRLADREQRERERGEDISWRKKLYDRQVQTEDEERKNQKFDRFLKLIGGLEEEERFIRRDPSLSSAERAAEIEDLNRKRKNAARSVGLSEEDIAGMFEGAASGRAGRLAFDSGATQTASGQLAGLTAPNQVQALLAGAGPEVDPQAIIRQLQSMRAPGAPFYSGTLGGQDISPDLGAAPGERLSRASGFLENLGLEQKQRGKETKATIGALLSGPSFPSIMAFSPSARKAVTKTAARWLGLED